MTDAQFTLAAVEAWVSSDRDPNTNFTQVAAEAWVSSDLGGVPRFTQAVSEVWVEIHRPQFMLSTQQTVEAWITTRGLGLTYPIYPGLPGLSYSVFWKPRFANAPTAVAANLAEIDLPLASTPVHEFTLTYDFLRNQTTYLGAGITNEFKDLFGFFLRLKGNAGRFLFDHPDDRSVTGEFVATTDGVTTDYGPLQRTFGVGANSGTEPVGYVNLTQPIAVYLDGVLVDPSNYDVVRTYPVNQQLSWHVAPAADQDITIDYYYYYYCKFAEPDMSFEKFMQLLWRVKQVAIRSNRGSA